MANTIFEGDVVHITGVEKSCVLIGTVKEVNGELATIEKIHRVVGKAERVNSRMKIAVDQVLKLSQHSISDHPLLDAYYCRN